MDGFAEAVFDFVRVRQLNFAVAGLLTVIYLIYQYWGALFRDKEDDELEGPSRRSSHRISRSRSRSRSCSRSRSRPGVYHDNKVDTKPRGGKRYGRCADCSKCVAQNNEC